jgi:hypothetical protein
MSATCYLLDFKVQPTKYQRWYDSIIANRQATPFPKDEYGEWHHIVPRSFGGSDDAYNLVRLTAREHFIVHWLLIKIHPTGIKHKKMVYALGKMVWVESKTQERYKVPARTYELLKKQFSELRKIETKGSKNPSFGTMWITNGKENIKIKKTDQLQDGWKKGRVSVPNLKFHIAICRTCRPQQSLKKDTEQSAEDKQRQIAEDKQRQIAENRRRQIAEKWYPKYLEYGSLRKLCDNENVEVSWVSLSKYFNAFSKN